MHGLNQKNFDEDCDKIQIEYFCNSKQAHQRIKKLTGKLRVHNIKRLRGLKVANGNTLTKKGEVVNRWQDYTEDFFSDPNRTCLPVLFCERLRGDPIASDETAHAMRHMKARNPAGPDKLTLELFQTLREDGLYMLSSLFNAI